MVGIFLGSTPLDLSGQGIAEVYVGADKVWPTATEILIYAHEKPTSIVNWRDGNSMESFAIAGGNTRMYSISNQTGYARLVNRVGVIVGKSYRLEITLYSGTADWVTAQDSRGELFTDVICNEESTTEIFFGPVVRTTLDLYIRGNKVGWNARVGEFNVWELL